MTTTTATQDFKVADLSLADFGRKEIELAEHEMPGLMADPRGVRRRSSRSRARASSGSLHMTIQTAVLIETLAALGAEVRWCSLQHLLDPGPRRGRGGVGPRARPRTRRASRSSPGRARRSRSTGGAPSRSLTWPDGTART